MTIEKSLQVLIIELTKGRNFKKIVKDFEKWIKLKDRTNDTLFYYLVYDIDKRDYKMKSEYNITHNQIALIKAIIPPKREKDMDVRFDEYHYKEKEPE